MDGEDLCLSCAMCCNGAIFHYIALPEDELAAAMAQGLEISGGRFSRGIPQPCVHLAGTRCTIYANRYRDCRTYRCVTLQALEGGEIDSAEARRRVGTAKTALVALERALPEGENVAHAKARRLRYSKEEAIPDFDARIVILLTALDRVIDRYFRFPSQQVIKNQPDTGGDSSSAQV